jgi:hypothetical protein
MGSHFDYPRKITYRVTPKIPNEVCEIRHQAPYANPQVIMDRLTHRVKENHYMD